MNLGHVKLTFAKEMRDFLRDKRTLFTMAFLPLVMYPLLLILFVTVLAGRYEPSYRLAVVYEFDRAEAGEAFAVQRLEAMLHPPGDDPPRPGDVIENAAQRTEPPFAKVYWNVAPQDAHHMLQRGAVDVVLMLPGGFADYAWLGGRYSPKVSHRGTDEDSIEARARLAGILIRMRNEMLRRRAAELGDPALMALLDTTIMAEPQATMPPGQQKGILLAKNFSRMLIFLVLTMALAGAFYPAIDTVAGEKERGTLETLLTSPAARIDLVTGKFLGVFLISVASALVNVLAMAATALAISRLQPQMAPGAPDATQIALLASRLAPAMMLILLPVAALFSALALAASAHARSSREAQYYFAPLFLAVMPLSLIALAPTIELTPLRALIPVGGASLLFREMFAKAIDPAYPKPWPWLSMGIVFVSTAAYAAVALAWTRRLFDDEEVLFREAGQRSLRALALRRYNAETGLPTRGQAVFMVLAILAAQIFLGELALKNPIAGHLVTMFGLFAGGSLLACRASRLNIAATLRLRAPRPAALLLGVGLLLALLAPLNELTRLMTTDAMAAEAERYVELIGAMFFEGINPWWSLVLVAAVPALCEEIFFRGYFLSGARQRSGLWMAALLTGAVFAAAHLQWYGFGARLVLGGTLAWVTLMSGSLWPAVAMHAGFNLRAVFVLAASQSPEHLLGRTGVWLRDAMPIWFAPEEVDRVGVRVAALAVSLMACAVLGVVLARLRKTPPGVREAP